MIGERSGTNLGVAVAVPDDVLVAGEAGEVCEDGPRQGQSARKRRGSGEEARLTPTGAEASCVAK